MINIVLFSKSMNRIITKLGNTSKTELLDADGNFVTTLHEAKDMSIRLMSKKFDNINTDDWQLISINRLKKISKVAKSIAFQEMKELSFFSNSNTIIEEEVCI